MVQRNKAHRIILREEWMQGWKSK